MYRSEKIGILVLVLFFSVIALIFGYKLTYDALYPEVRLKEVSDNYQYAKQFAAENSKCVVNSLRKPKHHQPLIWCGDVKFLITIPEYRYKRLVGGDEVSIQSRDVMCRYDWRDCIELKPEE